MKTKLLSLGLLVSVLQCLFSCSGNLDFSTSVSNPLEKEVSLTRSFDPKDPSSDNLFKVTIDDVTKLSKSLRPKKDCKYDVYEIDGDTLLYQLDYGDEWIIIAGDKRINPFVAESKGDEISFNTSNENLKAYLDSYADEIRVFKKNPEKIENEFTKFWNKISTSIPSIKSRTRDSNYKWAVIAYTYLDSETYSDLVSPLVTTKWGQQYPWNNLLPIDTTYHKHCLVGCAAVCLAQMIHYMHYRLGKPTGLYHDISISLDSIYTATTNIGFSRSNYYSNSPRWDNMALNGSELSLEKKRNTRYLMYDIGNRLNMVYSGKYSEATITASALSYYNLIYSFDNYNYQKVKNDLLNTKPVIVTAECDNPETGEREGHGWLIDGIKIKTSHYITEKHFEYTENWMYASEYYDSFDDLRRIYHINDGTEIIEEYTDIITEYLRMNWGQDGQNDNCYYSTYPSSTWYFIDYPYNYNFKYDKKIYYNFR